jgi:hypothetical protein
MAIQAARVTSRRKKEFTAEIAKHVESTCHSEALAPRNLGFRLLDHAR